MLNVYKVKELMYEDSQYSSTHASAEEAWAQIAEHKAVYVSETANIHDPKSIKECEESFEAYYEFTVDSYEAV
jgi:hypothetical protein